MGQMKDSRIWKWVAEHQRILWSIPIIVSCAALLYEQSMNDKDILPKMLAVAVILLPVILIFPRIDSIREYLISAFLISALSLAIIYKDTFAKAFAAANVSTITGHVDTTVVHAKDSLVKHVAEQTDNARKLFFSELVKIISRVDSIEKALAPTPAPTSNKK